MICCKFSTVNDTFEAVVRLPLLDKEQVQEYLKDVQEKTMTVLRISKTYPNVGQVSRTASNCWNTDT